MPVQSSLPVQKPRLPVQQPLYRRSTSSDQPGALSAKVVRATTGQQQAQTPALKPQQQRHANECQAVDLRSRILVDLPKTIMDDLKNKITEVRYKVGVFSLWWLTYMLEEVSVSLDPARTSKIGDQELHSRALAGPNGKALNGKTLENDYDSCRELAQWCKGALTTMDSLTPSRDMARVAKLEQALQRNCQGFVTLQIIPRWSVDQYLQKIMSHLQKMQELAKAAAQFRDAQLVRMMLLSWILVYEVAPEYMFEVFLYVTVPERNFFFQKAEAEVEFLKTSDPATVNKLVYFSALSLYSSSSTGRRDRRFPNDTLAYYPIPKAAPLAVEMFVSKVRAAFIDYQAFVKVSNYIMQFQNTLKGEGQYPREPERQVVWCRVNLERLARMVKNYLNPKLRKSG